MSTTDLELWNRYSTAALQAAASLVDGWKSYPARGRAVETARGSVDGSVIFDKYAAALVRFLDARMDGTGAERWIGNGVVSYAPDAHQLSLYGYEGYNVTARSNTSPTVAEFTVVLKRASGDVTEHITMADYAGGSDSLPPIIVSFAS